MRYLYATTEYSIFYSTTNGNFAIKAYFDTDWTNAHDQNLPLKILLLSSHEPNNSTTGSVKQIFLIKFKMSTKVALFHPNSIFTFLIHLSTALDPNS